MQWRVWIQHRLRARAACLPLPAPVELQYDEEHPGRVHEQLELLLLHITGGLCLLSHRGGLLQLLLPHRLPRPLLKDRQRAGCHFGLLRSAGQHRGCRPDDGGVDSCQGWFQYQQHDCQRRVEDVCICVDLSGVSPAGHDWLLRLLLHWPRQGLFLFADALLAPTKGIQRRDSERVFLMDIFLCNLYTI